MEPGHELDSLVAEKVMGWEMAPAKFGPEQQTYQCWHKDGRPMMTIHMWNPSTELNSVLLVWDKMREFDDGIYNKFLKEMPSFSAQLVTGLPIKFPYEIVPLKEVCLAALKAVGAL